MNKNNMTVKQLDHLNLSVRNLDETIAWYGSVFGFELVERDVQNGVDWGVIKGGDAMLCIYEYAGHSHLDRFERSGKGLHGMNHFALRIEDEEAWLATIEAENLEVLYDGVVVWPKSRSWYVKDPTGYEIEVALWNNDHIAFA